MAGIAVLFVVLATLRGVTCGLTDAEKQFIVDKHNEYRSQVTPPATNMPKMYWSETIAKAAEAFIQTCPNHHDSNDARSAAVGLNISIGQCLVWDQPSWSQAIDKWHDEVEYFEYGIASSRPGHFIQMSLANSTHIGCAHATCPGSKYTEYYVCEYSIVLNTDTSYAAPWIAGAACADCGGTCVDNLCDCGDKLCTNGAQLDTKTCTCQCPGLWGGETCDILNCPAEDKAGVCGLPRPNGFPVEYCEIWSGTVPLVCPYMCGVC